MKNRKILIGAVLAVTAAVLVAYAANGFRLPGDDTPKNRTTEQYEFEGTFNPMFDFLEKKEKDFTKIDNYAPSVAITDAKGDMVDYSIFLYVQNNPISGTYKISHDEYDKDAQKISVTYSDGQLHYEGELNPPFDEEIFNLSIDRSYFESLDVKETFKSAETELSDIIYKPENQSELFKKLVKKYNLSSDTKLTVRLVHGQYNNYGVSLTLESSERTVYILNQIFLKKGE